MIKICRVSAPKEIARYGEQTWKGDNGVVKRGWYFRLGSWVVGWLS